MKNNPITAVWEVTFACNMRCKHCGSGCTTFLEDELTTAEALRVCADMASLKLEYVTLSGGEPLLRKDWYSIALSLSEKGVIPNMITNGWNLNDNIVKQALDAGISNIAISIDGLKETHDFIRKQGSFDRILKAFKILHKNKMPSSAITTVNLKNISELYGLYKLLVNNGIKNWQMQYAMPMGNFVANKEWVIQPEQIDDIINFASKVQEEGRIRIDLADCVGYYNLTEIEIRKKGNNLDNYFWQGCPAGKHVFGIRYNGDVVGCTSLRDNRFIEGNVRDRSLVEIWNDPKSFAWNRELTKDKLTGFCAICQFGNYCLAGCSVLKFTTGKTLIETQYCSYKVAIDKKNAEIIKIHDIKELVSNAHQYIEDGEYQLAELCLSKANKFAPGNLEILNLLGLVHYNLENFTKSLEFSKKALAIDSQNAYAYKGLGLCLYSLGNKEESINSLNKSIEFADDSFADPYHDLAYVYICENSPNEALQVLNRGVQKSEAFKEEFLDLYELINQGNGQDG